MKINFIDLNRQYIKNKKTIDSAIQAVLDKSNFILGNQVEEFESKSKEYVGSDCIGVANGTDALFIALKALGVKKGDEVITPSFTWVSTVETIKLTGAKPVFIDIKHSDFNIDEDQITPLINKNTKVIIPVSIFGRCPNLIKIMQIASKNNLKVLEDGAQSYGAMCNGEKSCSIADISTTSFFPAKPLGCYGDGGAIYSKDKELFEEVSLISRHGQKGRYNYLRVGVNSRLDTIQAAILLEKHKFFEEEVRLRNKVALSYEKNLSNESEILTPQVPKLENRSVWAQYTIRLSSQLIANRDNIMNDLKSLGVPTALYYPKLLHKTKIYEDKVSLPVSEEIADSVLSLPMHPYLNGEEIDFISENLIRVIKKYK